LPSSDERIWAEESDESKGAYYNFKNGRRPWGEQMISITMHALPGRDTHHVAETILQAPASKPQPIQQRLQVLKTLHQQKIITDEEYNS